MTTTPYRGFRFPQAIIQHTIWLYLRFTLSLRDVEARAHVQLLRDMGCEVLVYGECGRIPGGAPLDEPLSTSPTLAR